MSASIGYRNCQLLFRVIYCKYLPLLAFRRKDKTYHIYNEMSCCNIHPPDDFRYIQPLPECKLYIFSNLFWLQMTIRWTLPRFRYDQIMKLGWKILLPISLINIFITGLVVLLK